MAHPSRAVPGVERFFDLEARDGSEGLRGGNPRAARHRSFCWTLNNYNEGSLQAIRERLLEHALYIAFQPERGASGTPHLQGVVVFRNARSV